MEVVVDVVMDGVTAVVASVRKEFCYFDDGGGHDIAHCLS